MRPSVWRVPKKMATLRLSGSGKPKTFGARYDAALSTVEAPVVVSSRWAYFTAATGTAFTVPANSAITFNGVDWITANGTTPAGAKRWKVRGLSSDEYETLVMYTPTLGGVNWPFAITTKINPLSLVPEFMEEDGTLWKQEDGTQAYQEG